MTQKPPEDEIVEERERAEAQAEADEASNSDAGTDPQQVGEETADSDSDPDGDSDSQPSAQVEEEVLAAVEQWDAVAPGEETVADLETDGEAEAGVAQAKTESDGDSEADGEADQTEESLLLVGESVDEELAPEQMESAPPAADSEEPLELVQQLEYVAPSGKDKKQQDDEGPELTFSSIADARAVLEGFLFTSNEPLSVQRLSKLMSNLHPRTVRGLVLELQIEYDQRGGALQIVEIAGGFQMATRPHLADWMFRMHRHKRRSALSPATLETLAIIAYKQPITKGEVEAIRGVESSGTVRTLQDLNLIEAGGRREVVGRPQLFVTTEQFLKAFGLRSLADLPSISELRTLFAADQKLKAATAKKPEPEAEVAEPKEPVAAEPAIASETESPEDLPDEMIAETDELEELDQADEEADDLEAEDQETDEDEDDDVEDLEDEDEDDEYSEDDDHDEEELEDELVDEPAEEDEPEASEVPDELSDESRE